MAVVGALVAKLSLAHAAFTRGCRTAAGSVTVLGRASRVASGGVRMLASSLAMAVGPIVGLYSAFRMMKVAETFQQEMNSSLAIVNGMTPRLRKAFEKQAKDLSTQLKYSAAEIAKGYYYLFSAGLTPEQSLAAMPTTAKFSQAAMIDMAEATDILTDAVTSLGLDSKDTATYLDNLNTVADKIAMTATKANASIAQFGQAVTNKAGASMKSMNIPLSEGLAILAAFASQAKKGEDAGTAFSIVLRDLTYMAIQNSEAMERLGVDVFDDKGQVRYIGMLKDLSNVLAGKSPEQKTKILIELGLPKKSSDFTKMLLGMTDMMRDVEKAADNAGGTVGKIAGKQLPEFTKAMYKLRAAVHEFAIEKLTEPMQTFGAALTTMLDATRAARLEQEALNTALGKTPSEAEAAAASLNEMETAAGTLANALATLKAALIGVHATLVSADAGIRTISRIWSDAGKLLTGQMEGSDWLGLMTDLEKLTRPVMEAQEAFGDAMDLSQWPSAKLKEAKIGGGLVEGTTDDAMQRLNKRYKPGRVFAEYDAARGPQLPDDAFDKLKQNEEFAEKAVKRVASIFDQTRTPMEKFRKETEDLLGLFELGAFKGAGGMETYIRALVAAMDEFDSGNVTSQLAALNLMLSEGKVSLDAYVQAQQRVQAGGSKQKPPEVQAPTLARAGSEEAYDLIRRHREKGKDTSIQVQQLQVQTSSNAYLSLVGDKLDAQIREIAGLRRDLVFEDSAL